MITSLNPDILKNMIERVDYHVFPETTVTVCCIVLKNGACVVGKSACIDPGRFNAERGREAAYNNTFAQLWEVAAHMAHEHNTEGAVWNA